MIALTQARPLSSLSALSLSFEQIQLGAIRCLAQLVPLIPSHKYYARIVLLHALLFLFAVSKDLSHKAEISHSKQIYIFRMQMPLKALMASHLTYLALAAPTWSGSEAGNKAGIFQAQYYQT